MLLSICIPTYNRASTLNELLNRINEEADVSNSDKIEIVICDNHSTDHTEEVVNKARLTAKFPIKYIKHSENKGLMRNLFSTVQYASGDFCWLMGSDDAIEKGALNRAISLIETNSDVAVFIPQFKIYDSTLSTETNTSIRPIHHFENGFIASPFNQYSKDIVYEFGFLSVLLFKREYWNNVPKIQQYETNFYYHVYIIIKIAQQYKLMLVQEKLIAYRSDNDSVLSSIGVYNRIRIIIEEYEILLREVFDAKTYKENMQQMLRFHIKGSLYAIQTTFSYYQRFKTCYLLLKHHASDAYLWTGILPKIFIPKGLINLSLRLQKRIP